MTNPLTTKQIASRIDAFLKGFEKDSNINICRDGAWDYFMPNVQSRGRWVWVEYAPPTISALSKPSAIRYLAWLEAGNIGTHRDAQRSIMESAR